jgi:hypothetical protein
VYSGSVATPAGVEVFASLLLRDDGSALVLLDAFRGFWNGPGEVLSSGDSTLTLSFHDGDGRELHCVLSARGDTLSGTVAYADGEFDLSAPVTLVYATPDVPTEEEFFAACLFVPADFTVPDGLETGWCRLRMLTVEDVELDYEAVMSSGEMLRELSGGSWPSPDMTLEDNLSDLRMHQSEHLSREAFTYTVVSLDEDSVLGCVYIMPPLPGGEAEAAVQFWLRQDLAERGMEDDFFTTLRGWIEAEWPFADVIYPGRTVTR